MNWKRTFITVLLAAWAPCAIAAAAGAAGPASQPGLGENILPNPSFELLEPPPAAVSGTPLALLGQGPLPEGKEPPPELYLPRTWEVWTNPGVQYRCVDDPAQAHTGRHCVSFKTDGNAAIVRYANIPIFDKQPWTIKVFARGKGTLVILARHWGREMGRQQVTLTEQWKEYQLQFVPPADDEVFWVDFTNSGPGEFWLDDASLSHPALAPLNMVPQKPLGKDEHTLLYLPCEDLRLGKKVGNVQFFTLDGVELLGMGKFNLADNQGRFGKGMGLWPGSCLVTSAGEHLNGKAGTIEVWVRLRTPRNDNISHCFVGVAGAESMYFGKFAFGQINFVFASGFRTQCGVECWPTPATQWREGVWRHFVAVWDKDMMEVFVDGKLVGWQAKPNLTKYPGDTMVIGGSNWGVDRGSFDFDDLRISDVPRWRFPIPPPRPSPYPALQHPR